MKAKQQKPTIKELSSRANYLLIELRQLQNYMSNLMELVNDYIEYKGDSDKFKKFIEKKLKKVKKSETPKTTSKK
tara:strand:+ start:6570 stop:6794 length:225 start_codon:yes stop_codon:yes gene_type:complete